MIMKAMGIVRKLDALGRYTLPVKARELFDIREGTAIEIYVTPTGVVLEVYKPKCVFCNSDDSVISYKEKDICSNCLNELGKM
jgi:transcriptional pleiotropic regulator of transition state genes